MFHRLKKTTVLNKALCLRHSVQIAPFSYQNVFSLIPRGHVVLRGESRKYATNSNFENFESALNFISVRMPLVI